MATYIEEMRGTDLEEPIPLIQELARLICENGVVKTRRQGRERPANDAIEEVVLEFEWKGDCYTLLRRKTVTPPEINLSPREQEIVRLVAAGRPNKTIAKILEISPWTVNTHIRRVFAKMKVSSRAEMVACAINLGLIR